MRIVITVALVATAVGGVARADKPAEEVYKNIQVLKGTPALMLGPVMDVMESALGVGCGYCHVRNADGQGLAFDKDDKAAKRTARKMVTMTAALNQQFFGGDQVVTCATCHAGSTQPKSVVLTRPPEENEGPKPKLTAQQLYDKWLQASGGAAAWKKAKTRLAKGTFAGHGAPLPVEIGQASGDRYYERLDGPRGPIDLVWNGTSGFRAIQTNVRPLPPQEVARLRRVAPLATPLALPKLISDAKVVADEGGAHVVVGKEGDETVRLFFDAKSGLLARVAVLVPTPIGELPQQWEYDDYRTVDGIKLPFVVRENSGGERSTLTFTSIENGAAIDEQRFQQGK